MQLNLANLIAALTIITLLAATLAPVAMEIGGTLAVEGAAEELVRELEATRQQAVSQNLTYTVTFERQGRAYYIKEADMHVPARKVSLSPGVIWLNFPFQGLTFYPSGRCSLAGTIILGHERSKFKIKLIVAPHTGRIRVQRGQR
jgi:Tfp pilus assembly protein FimT